MSRFEWSRALAFCIATCLTIAAVPCASAAPSARAATSDGVWAPLPVVPQVDGLSAAYDPVGDRLILFGGAEIAGTYDNATLAWPRGVAQALRALDAVDTGDPIPGRSYAQLVFDAPRERLVLYGGGGDAGYFTDTWTLASAGGARWTRLVPVGDPPTAGAGQFAVYDPPRDRMLVLDGAGNAWALSLGDAPEWTLLTPTGWTPVNLVAVAYDAPLDRVVVLTSSNTVRALDFTGAPASPAWSQLPASGLAPPFTSAAGFDPQLRAFVETGGVCNSDCSAITPATFVSSIHDATVTWSEPALSVQPAWRYTAATAYDASRHELLVAGGLGDGGFYGLLGGLWGFTPDPSPAWHGYGGDFGPPTGGSIDIGAWDGVHDRFIVAGEQSSGSPPAQTHYSGALALESAPGWSPLSNFAGDGSTAVYDRVHDQLVDYGGMDWHDGFAYGFLAAWQFDDEPAWSPPGPSPTLGFVASALDTRRDRMLLYSGYSAPADVWALSLTAPHAIEHLVAGGDVPPEGAGPAVIYDPVRDRMLVFAGSANGTPINDTYALDLGGAPAWTHLAPSGTPPAPGGPYFLHYDPVRDRMVVLSGSGGAWALDLSATPAWSSLSPSGAAPHLGEMVTAYDARRDRILVDGIDDSQPGPYTRSQVWTLTFDEPAQPVLSCAATVAAPSGGSTTLTYAVTNGLAGTRAIGWKLEADRAWPGLPQSGSAIVDGGTTQDVAVPIAVPDSAASGGVAVRFFTWYQGGAGNDASCQQSIVDVLAVPLPESRTRLALEAPRNPAQDLRVTFVLPDARPVMLEAFDVSGRLVSRQVLAGLAPGRHDARLGGTRPAPGVYLLRIQQGEYRATTRVAVLR